jgi:hypothetical protein
MSTFVYVWGGLSFLFLIGLAFYVIWDAMSRIGL